MAKTTVELVSELPPAIPLDAKFIDLRSLNEAQKKYFMEAWAAFQENPICWGFDSKWFGNTLAPVRSRFFDLVPIQGFEEPIQSPLYWALKELWFALGVNQGRMTSKEDKTIYVVIEKMSPVTKEKSDASEADPDSYWATDGGRQE